MFGHAVCWRPRQINSRCRKNRSVYQLIIIITHCGIEMALVFLVGWVIGWVIGSFIVYGNLYLWKHVHKLLKNRWIEIVDIPVLKAKRTRPLKEKSVRLWSNIFFKARCDFNCLSLEEKCLTSSLLICSYSCIFYGTRTPIRRPTFILPHISMFSSEQRWSQDCKVRVNGYLQYFDTSWAHSHCQYWLRSAALSV